MRRFSRSSPTPTHDPEADAASISSIDSDDEEEVPLVKFWFAAGMLVVVTAITGVTAEWLLDSIDGLTATGNVSREFVGLILLPVIGEFFIPRYHAHDHAQSDPAAQKTSML